MNRSLVYRRTGGLNLKQFSVSFQQEVLLVRELVRLGNLFSDIEMIVAGVDCFSKRAGLVVYV